MLNTNIYSARTLFVTLLCFFSSQVSAQLFKLERVTNLGSALFNNAFDAELTRIENEINQDFPSNSPERLMKGMADATAVSSRGLANDYLTHFEVFSIGAGVGLGADLEENKELDSDLSGFGITPGFLLGLHADAILPDDFLGLDPKRLTLNFSFMSYKIDKDVDDTNFKANTVTLGFMSSYHLIVPKGNRILGWDGVRLHTGYQYSQLDLDFITTLAETANIEVNASSNYTGSLNGKPAGTIRTKTHSIPLELSTGFNFLWFLSVYGGVGTDLNYGSAQGTSSLNADVSTVTCTGTCTGLPASADVQASSNIDEKAEVEKFFFRGFVGAQINLPFSRVFLTVNKVFGTEIYNLSTGLRLAF